MSKQQPDLPRYQLAKRPDNEDDNSAQKNTTPKSIPTEEPPTRTLELREAPAHSYQPDSMRSTSEMLEDAYGDENRARLRKDLLKKLNSISVLIVCIALFCAGTLAYAYAYKGWSHLTPTNWYLPFFLSTSLSAWVCIKAINLWEDRERWLAITGLVIAGLLTYWNVYIFQYATNSENILPSNGLWAPTDINDLLITTEINALRGVGKNKANYTELSNKEYYKAFNSTAHANWKPLFQRFLSSEEIKKVNSINIQNNMHLVVERMKEKRASTWDQLQEQIDQPEFEFQVRQKLIGPYTWALSHL
jgi:hypothetical protein